MARVPNANSAPQWQPRRENWHFLTTGGGHVRAPVFAQSWNPSSRSTHFRSTSRPLASPVSRQGITTTLAGPCLRTSSMPQSIKATSAGSPSARPRSPYFRLPLFWLWMSIRATIPSERHSSISTS